jgi:hypothetical protein
VLVVLLLVVKVGNHETAIPYTKIQQMLNKKNHLMFSFPDTSLSNGAPVMLSLLLVCSSSHCAVSITQCTIRLNCD